MMTFVQIAALSPDHMGLVTEFRILFQEVHGFECPEFDDFNDVGEFYSRLMALRDHKQRLAA